MTGKSALVVGATGLVGRQLIDMLLSDARYDEIRCLVRRPTGKTHAKLKEYIIDFDALGDHAAVCRVDDVFSCLGTTQKKSGRDGFYKVDHDYPVALAKQAKAQGASQFLLVSSVAANPRLPSYYLQTKAKTEADVIVVGLPTTIVFRPSLLLGLRDEFRLKEQAGGVVLGVLAPVMTLVWPLNKYAAIRAKTVACALVNAANLGLTGVNIFHSGKIARMGPYWPFP